MERRGTVPPAEAAAHAENDAERREWALTLPLITELLAADTVLIGVPMYNFSIPASLKASSSPRAAEGTAPAPHGRRTTSRRPTCVRTSASWEWPTSTCVSRTRR
ncbi:NAD(P)H-dependent oxidoreductase [Streptomyces niveus]